MQTLQKRVRELITDIPDFPIEGIVFKDILPLFRNPEIVKELTAAMASELKLHNPTALVAMESRGFLLGMPLALELNVPFICIRKKGKLPGEVSGISYALEYGNAEIEIQKSLLELMESKTTLVVAHRFSTLLHMDRILVFDQGKIVEIGSHQQLLDLNGFYKTLWNAQIEGFLPDEKISS